MLNTINFIYKDLVVLKSRIDGITIRNIYVNGSQNFDIILNNLSAETFQLKTTNNRL